jgi:enoyl-CoA hydratase
MASVNESHLLIERNGPVVTATLNRPQALNALSLDIIEGLTAALPGWEADEAVQAIILRGAGDRAFCAGGDIKAAYYAGQEWLRNGGDDAFVSHFFRLEYRLNRALFHCRKPIVALMDGITMGGGFGLAGQARFRVATEKTLFAMPETAIGFFPDVGSIWHLNRAPDRLGHYLAVTGNHVPADDMIAAGLAEAHVPSAQIPALYDALCAGEEPQAAIARFATPPVPGRLREQAGLIAAAFAAPDIDGILARLRTAGPFGVETADAIATRSPTSVKLALAYINRMRGQDFDAVIAHDYRIAQHILKGHDFYEGVRAMVIDKDRQPRWNPDSLAGVSDQAVAAFFAPAHYPLDE